MRSAVSICAALALIAGAALLYLAITADYDYEEIT